MLINFRRYAVFVKEIFLRIHCKMNNQYPHIHGPCLQRTKCHEVRGFHPKEMAKMVARAAALVYPAAVDRPVARQLLDSRAETVNVSSVASQDM